MWKFHRVCGKNVSLENDCTTAKRLNPTDTSDHGICFTNTPLVNGELFEIQVEELVTRWGGSFSTGFGIQGIESGNLVRIHILFAPCIYMVLKCILSTTIIKVAKNFPKIVFCLLFTNRFN
ncbi:Hypothetical predicted protein [Mytilus galloprovincialis]|uniref:NHR domain-containing protein n=2 Tax=Mytilus galloprovincialis TaxID=29158 RepID=A0A8B6CRR7_MYTGA|nr:Hypothetical predicted protein [Mytilus galloprovincialis]